MAQLSVNLNKIALIRNSREGHAPNVVDFALSAIAFGAQGITVHPRPDARHIRRDDVFTLGKAINVEFNIEGNPMPEFNALVHEVKPAQVTLVPDDPAQLTSDHGWDLKKEGEALKPIIQAYRDAGIRVSLFMDPVAEEIARARECGADRVELYTEAYAAAYGSDDEAAILKTYVESAQAALDAGLGVNAGHDLNQANLGLFCREVPEVLEVSIGHALISEALVDGWETTIRNYVSILQDAAG
ncbi:MAG: pyridoxine 5'-phosphate synthase [Candidatus Hydrogenedentota bacterium]